MSVTPEDVRKVAALARLSVDDARLATLTRELASILEHMRVLEKVDTAGAVEADSLPVKTPLRADTGPAIPLAAPPQSFAPEMRDGFFLVPRLATHGEQEEDRAP